MSKLNPRQRNTPPFPEGTEIVFGLIFAGFTWWMLTAKNYTVWVFVPAMVLIYFAVVFAWSSWTEDDRLYIKSQELLKEISKLLNELLQSANQVRSRSARDDLAKGFTALKDALDELTDLGNSQPGAMYYGLAGVQTKMQRLNGLLPPYVDLQNHPSRGGAKTDQLMAEAEQGFTGFKDWAEELSQQVGKGEVFAMTTNARILRTLRKFLPI